MSTKGDKDNSIWYDGRVMAPMWTCGWPVWICWTPWLSIFGTVLTRVITMQIKKISLSFLVFFFYVAYRGLFLWWTGDCSTSCIYILPSYLQYTHCSSLISPCFSVENHVLFHSLPYQALQNPSVAPCIVSPPQVGGHIGMRSSRQSGRRPIRELRQCGGELARIPCVLLVR